MKPVVGQPVHYVGEQRICHAAIITEVPPANPQGIHTLACLMVIAPSGALWLHDLSHDEERGPSSWHYPHE